MNEEKPYLYTNTQWEDLLEYNHMTWINIDRFNQLQQENHQLKDRIDKVIVYTSTQKSKLYKKRNKPGLYNLINIEKMLLGKVKE